MLEGIGLRHPLVWTDSVWDQDWKDMRELEACLEEHGMGLRDERREMVSFEGICGCRRHVCEECCMGLRGERRKIVMVGGIWFPASACLDEQYRWSMLE